MVKRAQPMPYDPLHAVRSLLLAHFRIGNEVAQRLQAGESLLQEIGNIGKRRVSSADRLALFRLSQESIFDPRFGWTNDSIKKELRRRLNQFGQNPFEKDPPKEFLIALGAQIVRHLPTNVGEAKQMLNALENPFLPAAFVGDLTAIIQMKLAHWVLDWRPCEIESAPTYALRILSETIADDNVREAMLCAMQELTQSSLSQRPTGQAALHLVKTAGPTDLVTPISVPEIYR